MLIFNPALAIPDSLLAKEATEILREHSTDLLFNHSIRVYLFAAEQGRQQKLRFDTELLYVAAAFHDLGLTKKFSSQNERFEVDGANAVRQFLTAHNVPEEQVQTAWEAIALHTTPGVTPYMRPEIALLYSGVGLDVLGKGFDQFPSELRDEIVATYPRKHFKESFLWAYFEGFAHKPGTTFGTVNAGVCERFIPGYKSPNACDAMLASPSRIPNSKADCKRVVTLQAEEVSSILGPCERLHQSGFSWLEAWRTEGEHYTLWSSWLTELPLPRKSLNC